MLSLVMLSEQFDTKRWLEILRIDCRLAYTRLVRFVFMANINAEKTTCREDLTRICVALSDLQSVIEGIRVLE